MRLMALVKQCLQAKLLREMNGALDMILKNLFKKMPDPELLFGARRKHLTNTTTGSPIYHDEKDPPSMENREAGTYILCK